MKVAFACWQYLNDKNKAEYENRIEDMKYCAKAFAKLGYSLRSGGEANDKELFESSFAENKIERFSYRDVKGDERVEELVKQNYPNYDEIKDNFLDASRIRQAKAHERELVGKEVYKILGSDLKKPVDMLVVFLPNGANCAKEVVACDKNYTQDQYNKLKTLSLKDRSGVAGFAVILADNERIPVYNVALEKDRKKLTNFIFEQFEMQGFIKAKEETEQSKEQKSNTKARSKDDGMQR